MIVANDHLRVIQGVSSARTFGILSPHYIELFGLRGVTCTREGQVNNSFGLLCSRSPTILAPTGQRVTSGTAIVHFSIPWMRHADIHHVQEHKNPQRSIYTSMAPLN